MYYGMLIFWSLLHVAMGAAFIFLPHTTYMVLDMEMSPVVARVLGAHFLWFGLMCGASTFVKTPSLRLKILYFFIIGAIFDALNYILSGIQMGNFSIFIPPLISLSIIIIISIGLINSLSKQKD